MSRLNMEHSRLENPFVTQGFKLGITRLGDANATLTVNSGPVISITPTASRTITLPTATAALKGLTFIFVNAAAFTLVVRTGTPTTIATVPATVGATGIFVCLGDTTLGVEGWSGGL